VAAISGADAEDYRLPKTGAPALIAEAPPGWTGRYTGASEMAISPADDMAVLELSMISDASLAAKPLPEVATQLLRDADLSPRWSSTEPDSIGGVAGQAFTVIIARDGAPVGTARLVIAKIDPSHIARLTEITLLKETPPEQLEALKGLVSHLRISGR
jgi:hypothetical protein